MYWFSVFFLSTKSHLSFFSESPLCPLLVVAVVIQFTHFCPNQITNLFLGSSSPFASFSRWLMMIVLKAETWRLSEQGDVWWGETAGFPAIHFFKQWSTMCYHPQGYTVHCTYTVCNANTSKVLVSFLASCPWVPAIQSPNKMLNNKKVFKEDNYCQGPCFNIRAVS